MRRAGVITLICLAATCAAGCSGDLSGLGGLGSGFPSGDPGAQTSGPTKAPTPTLEPTAQFFSMCDVVNLSEVQALSPLRTALAEANPDQDDINGCNYTSSIDPPVKWPNGFFLTFTDFLTAERALASLEDDRAFAADEHGLAVSEVAALGDKAYTFSESDYNTTVETAFGQYVVTAVVFDSGNLEFPQVPRAGKAAAGAQLLKLALPRLP
jgi:hypothetical protein